MNYRIVTLFSLLLVIVQLSAQKIYEVTTQYPVHNLETHLQLIEDKNKSFTVERILADTSMAFSLQGQLPKRLRIGSTYWGKITLRTNKELKGWTLNLEDRLEGWPAWSKSNGQVDVYAFSKGQLLFHKKTGVEYPAEERELKDDWFLNKVKLDELPVNNKVDLLIKIKGNGLGTPPYFNATLRSPEHSFYHKLFTFNESFNMFMFGAHSYYFPLSSFAVYLFATSGIFLVLHLGTFLHFDHGDVGRFTNWEY